MFVQKHKKMEKDGGEVEKYLIINRINVSMLQGGEMLKSEDILDILGINLLGKVPEDRGIIDASNRGKPIILNQKSEAGAAFNRIAARLCGEEIPLKDLENPSSGLLKKITGIFK